MTPRQPRGSNGIPLILSPRAHAYVVCLSKHERRMAARYFPCCMFFMLCCITCISSSSSSDMSDG